MKKKDTYSPESRLCWKKPRYYRLSTKSDGGALALALAKINDSHVWVEKSALFEASSSVPPRLEPQVGLCSTSTPIKFKGQGQGQGWCTNW